MCIYLILITHMEYIGTYSIVAICTFYEYIPARETTYFMYRRYQKLLNSEGLLRIQSDTEKDCDDFKYFESMLNTHTIFFNLIIRYEYTFYKQDKSIHVDAAGLLESNINRITVANTVHYPPKPCITNLRILEHKFTHL